MARNENDVTDGASSSEGAATERARRRALEGDAPPSASAIGEAVARAMERMANAPKEPERALPEKVRASVRCGYETTRRVLSDGSTQMVTAPASIKFSKDETADGKEWTIPHGRPVMLKREAFLRYQSEGRVVIAQ